MSTTHLHSVNAGDIYASADYSLRIDVLDYQREPQIVVFRNERGTKVVMRHDDPTGAVEIKAEPQQGVAYELYLGPQVPFDVLTAMMEHL